MADNYLEKKMEDLRMGKTGTSAPRRRLTPGAGRICFDFPPRRVLVAGGCHGIGEAIVDAYLHAGCKVAVFDTDKDKGSAMARNKGIRFYPISPSAPYSAFTNLLKAWRDIDIIIVNAASPSSPISPYSALSSLPRLWAEHRHRYPIPTEYAGRFILLLPSAKETPSAEETPSSETQLAPHCGSVQRALLAAKDLSPLGITTNILRFAPPAENSDHASPAEIPDHANTSTKNAAYSRIISRILLLSLPSASFITGMDIPAS